MSNLHPIITRRFALAALGAAAALPYWPMFDATAAPLHYPIEPQKIADGVWVIFGANEPINMENGGAIANIAILDSSEGSIIIDTGPSLRFGSSLKSTAEQLTGKSVARVLITHFHPDHVFGNQAFEPSALSAPQGVVDGLSRAGEDFASAMYHLTGDWMRGTELTLPTKIIDTGHEEIGERRLHYIVLGGHTDTDLMIFEERSGILFGGDLVFLDRAPTTPHADLQVWRNSLERLEEIRSDRIVPGHGPVEHGTRSITQTRDWLNTIEEVVRSAFDKGLSITEAFSEPLPDWAERIALARYEFERTVMHLYPKLEASVWPRVDR